MWSEAQLIKNTLLVCPGFSHTERYCWTCRGVLPRGTHLAAAPGQISFHCISLGWVTCHCLLLRDEAARVCYSDQWRREPINEPEPWVREDLFTCCTLPERWWRGPTYGLHRAKVIIKEHYYSHWFYTLVPDTHTHAHTHKDSFSVIYLVT